MRRSGHGISNAGPPVVALSGSTPGNLHRWVLKENTSRKLCAEFPDSMVVTYRPTKEDLRVEGRIGSYRVRYPDI